MILLGVRLKQLRCYHSMTQREVALYCEVTQSAISQIEAGVMQPSLDTLVALCALYDCPIQALFTGTEFDSEYKF